MKHITRTLIALLLAPLAARCTPTTNPLKHRAGVP
jgi:hypothetical protein